VTTEVSLLTPTKGIHVRLDEDNAARIARLARETGRSVVKMANVVIRDALRRKSKAA